jgi:DNA repair protein RecN (Recombination protein N)
LKIRERLLQHLQSLASQTDIENSLKEKLAEARKKYLAKAEELSERRRRAIPSFEKSVYEGLRQVALENATFRVHQESVEVSENSDGSEFSASGLDKIFLQLSANPGESLKPLSQVASGGELSRISLAIQLVAAKASPVATLVFDEVDSGIGGAVAQTIGRSLKRLGKDRQVLCVTHLPQVAASADAQWTVSKSAALKIRVQRLDRGARIEELARMLGGAEATARRHAAELLGGQVLN